MKICFKKQSWHACSQNVLHKEVNRCTTLSSASKYGVCWCSRLNLSQSSQCLKAWKMGVILETLSPGLTAANFMSFKTQTAGADCRCSPSSPLRYTGFRFSHVGVMNTHMRIREINISSDQTNSSSDLSTCVGSVYKQQILGGACKHKQRSLI